MNFENPFAYGTLILHPMWDYESVLRELEQTKKCCPFGQHLDLNSERVCSLHGLHIPSISESQGKDLHQKPNKSMIRIQSSPSKSQMCPKKQEGNSHHQNPKTLIEQNDETNENQTETEEIKYRRRRSKRLNIRAKLIRLRSRILNNRESSFNHSLKKTRYTSNVNLNRRSKFIGVSKNNTHWQSLITVDRVKKYIGIFNEELEAAKTYDLYAVAIKGKRACLNFDYTSQEMLELINFYLMNSRVNMEAS
eukprot:CAMPEP_0197001140 /NCGR_PEP_ID=MMETSP1380-20130617/5904_1 /TAXON_ID=5936 /ORGANISM="Euplotes crassus, Strain CT5" /LENGTH=249 /DNA_ID=CAMNT_0042418689 /DNA_START=1539 /DNA_END=2288 /DNA_ORIENTATION=+